MDIGLLVEGDRVGKALQPEGLDQVLNIKWS